MLFTAKVPRKFIDLVDNIQKPVQKNYDRVKIHQIENRHGAELRIPFRKHQGQKSSIQLRCEIMRDLKKLEADSPRTIKRK